MRSTILCVLFLTCLLLLSSCTHWLYAPSAATHYDVSTLPITPTEDYLTVAKNQKIHLWYFKTPHQNPKALLAHFHGNGENQSTHFMFFYWALAHGYDLVNFDYRGYGKSHSPGKLHPQSTVEDGLAVFSHIQKLRHRGAQKKLPVVAIGQSLGGAVLMKTVSLLPSEQRPDFLVLDSTFSSYQQAARSVLSQSWLLTLFKPLTFLVIDDSWSPKSQLASLDSIPKVLLHSTDDRIIRYELGQKLMSDLGGEKFFWTIPQGGHTSAFLPDLRPVYSEKLTRCLEKYFLEKTTQLCAH